MKTKDNYSTLGKLLIALGITTFVVLLVVLFVALPTMQVSISPIDVLAGPNKCPDDHAGCVWVQKIKKPWQCMWKPPNYNRKVWQAILPEGYCPDEDDDPKPTEPEPTDILPTDIPPTLRPTVVPRPTDIPPTLWPTHPPRPTSTQYVPETPAPTATLTSFTFPVFEQKCNLCLLIERCVLALERIALAQERQVDVQSAIATAISK